MRAILKNRATGDTSDHIGIIACKKMAQERRRKNPDLSEWEITQGDTVIRSKLDKQKGAKSGIRRMIWEEVK